MPSVIFSLAAIGAGEVAATSVQAFQPNVSGAWVLIDSAVISALPANPENAAEKIWASILIDDTKDLLLAPVSASLVVRMNGIAPVPGRVAADLTTLYLTTKDLLMVVDVGTKLIAKLVGSDVVLGGALISRSPHTFESDANGISFIVGRGAKVSVEFAPFGIKTFDTTGKDSINMATGAVI